VFAPFEPNKPCIVLRGKKYLPIDRLTIRINWGYRTIQRRKRFDQIFKRGEKDRNKANVHQKTVVTGY